MKKLTKLTSLIFSIAFFGFLMAPSALAVECDTDGDGYITISDKIMKEVVPTATSYKADGNFTAAQWANFYKLYKEGKKTTEETCNSLNFKKGAEPSRCDATIVSATSGVYDTSKVTSSISGSSVYPGALDKAGNGIDEDCDGKDGKLLAGTGTKKDLGGLVDKTISLLSKLVVVVSILIMIWGGVLYSTAAGDEAKTAKARKAIIGAVIGLIVGLLAPSIVTWVASNI